MYFDRILFSAVFATLLTTAALALVPAERPAAAAPQIAEQQQLPSLERVVITAKKDAANI